MVFGASKNDSIMYENEQGKLCRIIKDLTLGRSLELGISRKTYFDWKKKFNEGKQIILKNKLKITLLKIKIL